MSNCDIGIYGLAVMGQNLALNIADHDFRVAVFNRTTSKTKDFVENEAKGKSIEAAFDLSEFIQLIRKPRVILLIVKAGDAIDAVIEQLRPHLEADDIIIDGGNSYFEDTDRRTNELNQDHIRYIGMGVSGGEEGARHGPSLMPGGTPESYARVQNILEAIAAKAEGEPCVAYLGPGSSGHYVKMVHNGIEYAIMQATAEVYDILTRTAGMKAQEIGTIFQRWNQGKLASFLVDITAQVLLYTEPETDLSLVDFIADRAKQKGTGKWTTQDALNLGVAVPTISEAVEARILSALKEEREHAATILSGPPAKFDGDKQVLIKSLESALLATMICSYAQGFAVLRLASSEYNYNLKLADVAKIWRNGCIIRADMLNDMCAAFEKDNVLPNLMLDSYFAQLVQECQDGWRNTVQIAVARGIPVPAISSALAYYDGYRSDRLPANLIQAQRDYFGAHTYERMDREGMFHTRWLE